MKKMMFIYLFTLLIGATLYAQQSYSFMYNEWPDGCLTMPFGEGHYDYSGKHRNDNAQVRNEIEFFNNWVRQNNATVTREEKQLYSPGVGTRSAEIYTNIILVATSSGGSSGSSSSSSGYYPSTTSSYNPADSNHLQIGYNYAYEAPFGITIGDSMFFEKSLMYISFNFGYASDPSKLTLEWTYGIAFSLNSWLRLPVAIGGNHIGRDGLKQTGSSNGVPTYSEDPLSEWEHAFVIEAGLQPVIKDRFYFSATYRLKGFSKSGFAIGAGVMF